MEGSSDRTQRSATETDRGRKRRREITKKTINRTERYRLMRAIQEQNDSILSVLKTEADGEDRNERNLFERGKQRTERNEDELKFSLANFTETEFIKHVHVPKALFKRFREELFNVLIPDGEVVGRKEQLYRANEQLREFICLLYEGVGNDGTTEDGKESIDWIHKFKYMVKAFLKKFGRKFLNRRPTESELVRIEQSYRRNRLPGCVGVLECWKVQETTPDINRERNSDKESHTWCMEYEAWCDLEDYCWSWNTERLDNVGREEERETTPLIKELFDGSFNLINVMGYKIPPSSIVRSMMYFVADGEFPAWPIFIPYENVANRRDIGLESRSESAQSREEGTSEAILKEKFFIRMRRKFKVLCSTERFEGIIKKEEIIMACIIMHNIEVRMKDEASSDSIIPNTDGVSRMMRHAEDHVIMVNAETERRVLAERGSSVGGENLLKESRMYCLTDRSERELLEKNLTEHWEECMK